MENWKEDIPRAHKADWQKQVEKDLKGASFEEKLIHTPEGIAIQPLYTAQDLPELQDDESASFWDAFEDDAVQGEAPEEPVLAWNICEEYGGDMSALNDAVLAARQRGVNYIRVHGDWDMFFDEVRKVQYLASYVVDARGDLTEENMVQDWRERIALIGSRDQLITAFEFDPVHHFITSGNIPDANKSFNNLAHLFFKLGAYLHDCKLVKTDITAFAHADVVTQIVYALAITHTYLEELEKREVPVEEIIPLFSFRIPIGNHYFSEIAKVRALRMCLKNVYAAYMEDISFLPAAYIHGVTYTHVNTSDKHNNILRDTTAAMAAVIGGCDVLSVAPFSDDATDQHALRTSTHIQNMLRFESHLDSWRDVANGSYFIENYTVEIARKAWEGFQQLVLEGGFLQALEQNTLQIKKEGTL